MWRWWRFAHRHGAADAHLNLIPCRPNTHALLPLDTLLGQAQDDFDAGIVFLAGAAFLALLPFPIAWDIAGTSSCCDELMAELNKARIKHGEEVHLKIHCLETALKQLVRPSPPRCRLPASTTPLPSSTACAGCWQNRGQGLGFAVAGTVINRRSLMAGAVKLSGALSVVVTSLLALATARDSSSSAAA